MPDLDSDDAATVAVAETQADAIERTAEAAETVAETQAEAAVELAHVEADAQSTMLDHVAETARLGERLTQIETRVGEHSAWIAAHEIVHAGLDSRVADAERDVEQVADEHDADDDAVLLDTGEPEHVEAPSDVEARPVRRAWWHGRQRGRD